MGCRLRLRPLSLSLSIYIFYHILPPGNFWKIWIVFCFVCHEMSHIISICFAISSFIWEFPAHTAHVCGHQTITTQRWTPAAVFNMHCEHNVSALCVLSLCATVCCAPLAGRDRVRQCLSRSIRLLSFLSFYPTKNLSQGDIRRNYSTHNLRSFTVFFFFVFIVCRCCFAHYS